MEISLHSLEWQKPKILTTPNAGKAVKQQELSFIAGGNAGRFFSIGMQDACKNAKFWKTVWQFLTKLNHTLPI